MADAPPFWKTTRLEDMTQAQWESLCDGCAKCCLVKLEDEESGDVAFTDVVCDLLDQGTCRCTQYDRRTELVPDCVKLTPDNLARLPWMPPSCAYRLLYEGKELSDWHPLVSGRAESVVEAGMSVRGRAMRACDFDGDLEDRVVDWPLKK